MKNGKIYNSAKIIYEIYEHQGEYSLEVYSEGCKDSNNPYEHCKITNMTNELSVIEAFVELISTNCAQPIHIPELAEDYLS